MKKKPKLKALQAKELEKIHLATLHVLEHTGVKVSHPKVLDLLGDAGARIDNQRVRISCEMVDDALKKAPSRLTLGKRNGQQALTLEGNKSWFGPSLDCIDSQAAAEATFSCYSSAFSGAHLIHDCGLLDHGSLASPAYMVLVYEVIQMINQYVRGIEVNEETLALDVIEQVGPGGHFIAEAHTLKHFKEVWYSKLFDRTVYESWLERGGRRFDERLQEQTLRYLEHRPEELPKEKRIELDRMAKCWQG